MKTGASKIRRAARSTKLLVFDFDGVFTDNTVYVAQDGSEAVRCWRGDGLGLRKLEQIGLPFLILSTETNSVVRVRAEKLKARCIHGVADKVAELRKLAKETGISLDQVAYVGNDINDLECLSAVGFPIVVADAHDDVRSTAKLVTKTVGGRGAVREVCDFFARALA